MDFIRSRVTAYEPHVGEPPASDPLEVEIAGKQRNRLINALVLYGLLAALLLVLSRDPATLVLVGILAAIAAVSLWVLFLRVLPGRRLMNLPTVLVTPGPGQLLVSSSTVSVALPGAQWVVVRLPRSKRIQLAGVRRLFLVGPDARGRVLVALPGGITARFGRLRTAAVSGSVEPGSQPHQPVPAAQDPVLVAFVREVWWRTAGTAIVLILVAALFLAGNAYLDAPVTGGLATVIAVFYVLFGLLVLSRAATLASAVRSQAWHELPATLDTAIEAVGFGALGGAEGRAMLSDGEAVVRFRRQPIDLLVNVRATGRLWVLGEPRRGKKVVVGLPGHPIFAMVKLG